VSVVRNLNVDELNDRLLLMPRRGAEGSESFHCQHQAHHTAKSASSPAPANKHATTRHLPFRCPPWVFNQSTGQVLAGYCAVPLKVLLSQARPCAFWTVFKALFRLNCGARFVCFLCQKIESPESIHSARAALRPRRCLVLFGAFLRVHLLSTDRVSCRRQ
jgi:hypothetical protein